MAFRAGGVVGGTRPCGRRLVRVVAVDAGELSFAADIAAALEHAGAMTGNAERFGLTRNEQVVPLIEQPLAGAKIERGVIRTVKRYVALQVTLKADVVCQGR